MPSNTTIFLPPNIDWFTSASQRSTGSKDTSSNRETRTEGSFTFASSTARCSASRDRLVSSPRKTWTVEFSFCFMYALYHGELLTKKIPPKRGLRLTFLVVPVVPIFCGNTPSRTGTHKDGGITGKHSHQHGGKHKRCESFHHLLRVVEQKDASCITRDCPIVYHLLRQQQVV